MDASAAPEGNADEYKIEQARANVEVAENAVEEAKKSVDEWVAYKKTQTEAKKTATAALKAANAEDENYAELKAAKEAVDTELKHATENTAQAREALKAAKEQLKADKAAYKEVNKKPKKEKLNLRQANGVTEPRPGTKCRGIWDISDNLLASAGNGAGVFIKDVLAQAQEAQPDTSPITVRIQHNKWRKFNGIAPQERAKKSEEPAGTDEESAATEEA